ncbi:SusC/RagA family TonB-linked outer membrane protein [Aestuariivivens insulae]|uniref:SusC/RagA family TonB-linked outer membrane protein n=1 Tax=Aestuariivivens insulae TaxID=1621988 RepID=UPI001F5AD3E4|nr:TonB-dependent receptor [Aestuariivivens insulae]
MKKNNSHTRQIVYMCMMFFTSVCMYGQTTITGTVTSIEDGQPIPGANVLIKGTTKGASTDFDGKYTIEASANDILVFSYIGYETVEKTVGSNSVLDIVLKSSAEQLDDIVVIGYGTAKKSDLTGSVSTVSAKDFEKQPITRAEDALQSRTAGVNVSKNSGAPGGNIKIRVRGSNSITGSNDPLVVIDGIIGGDLSSLNASDIQSIDVLKDASATAIYGSRGANGVVMVTTKKGKSGEPQINLNYFISSAKIPKKIDLLSPSEFASLAGTTVSGGGADYQDEYFQTALTNNLQLSASGNEGRLNYYLSGNLVDQEGIVMNTNYKRYSLRSNLNADLNDKLSVGLNIYGSKENALNLIRGGSGASSDTRGGVVNVLSFNPALSVRDSNGDYNLQSSYGSILVNPIAVQNERDGNLVEDRLNANLNLSYDISESLNFTILAGASSTHFNEEIFEGIPAGSSVLEGRASFNAIRTNNYQLSNILTWNKDFGNTNLKLTGIYELQSATTKIANIGSQNYAISGLSDAFYLLELGQTQTIGANQVKSAIDSYVARAEVNVANNLLVTGTIRIDESSRFREGNRTGYFPSVSAAYNLGQFISEDSFINNIKVRAGYGETGNQNIPPFSTYQSLATGNNYFFSGSSFNIGLANGALVDEDLTWETTKQFNAGLDFRLANGRVNLSVDWFKKNTTDLLLDLPVPQFNGGGVIRTNVGEVQNTGVDVSLSAVVFDTDNFKWDANLTMSAVSNKVLNLGGLDQILTRPNGINPGGTGNNLYIVEEGQPLGNFYGFSYLGADANGVAQYADSQGVIGNGIPDFTWGLNNTLTYKNFDLNMLFRGVHGYDVLNATRGMISLASGDVTVPTSADMLKSDSPTSGTNHINSTRYIEDGSFIRLSNLSLGYTLPEVKGFKSLKIYVSAQNVFTITDYTGYDPEVSSTGTSSSDATPSLDFGALPNPRTFTLGVNLGF